MGSVDHVDQSEGFIHAHASGIFVYFGFNNAFILSNFEILADRTKHTNKQF